jgi:hypothetical protein
LAETHEDEILPDGSLVHGDDGLTDGSVVLVKVDDSLLRSLDSVSNWGWWVHGLLEWSFSTDP